MSNSIGSNGHVTTRWSPLMAAARGRHIGSALRRCADVRIGADAVNAGTETKPPLGYNATPSISGVSAISNDENGCRHLCLFIRIFINNFFQTF